MIRIVIYLITSIVLFIEAAFSQDTRAVSHCDRLIVSPHTQVALFKGAKEAVTNESTTVKDEKLNIQDLNIHGVKITRI